MQDQAKNLFLSRIRKKTTIPADALSSQAQNAADTSEREGFVVRALNFDSPAGNLTKEFDTNLLYSSCCDSGGSTETRRKNGLAKRFNRLTVSKTKIKDPFDDKGVFMRD